jgi:hypothetical protein
MNESEKRLSEKGVDGSFDDGKIFLHEAKYPKDGNVFLSLIWAFGMCGSEAGASFK